MAGGVRRVASFLRFLVDAMIAGKRADGSGTGHRRSRLLLPTLIVSVALLAWVCPGAGAVEDDLPQRLEELEKKLEGYDELKREVDRLKRQLGEREEAEKRAAEAKPSPPVTQQRPPFEVRIGRGTAQLGGLLQVWGLRSESDIDEFRLRRSEIKLSGSIIDSVGYTVMLDPAKTLSENKTIIVGTRRVTLSQPKSDSKILQDLFLSLRFFPHHVIDVGQKKIPVSMEGIESSAKLDFAERAIVSGATFRGVRGFGDFRDPGIQVTGEWPRLAYTVGVFNGEGPNASDKNDRKDWGERVVVKPFPWLHLGGSRYDGWLGRERARRNRTGAEFKVDRDPVFVKGEYILAHDGPIRKEGWYASGGYRLGRFRLGGIPFGAQLVARYEEFDPDTDLRGDTIRGPTLGLNLLLDDYYSKIQLNYTHFEAPGEDEDLLLAAFQVAF